ncbi:disulfide bond formation protein B [Phaeobacter sp. HF9A]|uniref:disulfide bond formation protein B n=1 Tax=Phaeobacter sp. HF9A TaxID=2721561 RepID=UPI001430427D|nr:disulfide bond formation protein B [Phaeobacter sp. HF9A]NIZ12683.1 disulfide bond formation protein B [Phaeobacter sp. HF9A]
MTFSRFLVLLAAAGSAALLLGAFGFQYIGDMAPCKMCLWQRYPHGVAIGIGVLALLIPGAFLPYLGALAALTSAGIGAFHAGVEQGWWPGPTTCTSGPISGLSADELMNQIMNAPLVRWDEIAWQMFGLSMAGWNAVISLALAAIWFAAARHSRRG